MKLISGILKWLLVAIMLVFGLVIVIFAYMVHVCKVFMQHKQQAAHTPAITDAEPATVSVYGQPVIRVHRVEFDETHTRWLNK